MKYPNECCRCGFCCLNELCPVVKRLMPDHDGICPYLSFARDIASCALAGNVVSIGNGCCIKATAYKDGKGYDFASLSPILKHIAANQLKRKIFLEC